MTKTADRPVEQKFPCRESACTELVEYHWEPIFAGWGKKTTIPNGTKMSAYLTCRKGHVHPYEVIME